MNEEIRRLFPDFLTQTSETLFYTRIKQFVLLACRVYSEENPLEEDRREVQKRMNWFYTRDGGKELDEGGIEVERNFLMLLSLLELKTSDLTIEFYSKLDYLNKKNKRESEQLEQSHNGR